MQPYSGDVLEQLLIRNFITTSTVMVKRECLLSSSKFDESERLKGVEDYKMWLHIAERYKVVYIDKPLTMYRYHSNSLSVNRSINNLSALHVVEDYWKTRHRYKKNKLYLYYKSIAEHLFVLGSSCCENGQLREGLKYFKRGLGYKLEFTRALKEMLKASLRYGRIKLKSLS
jgi:hypothetical protein